VSPRGCAPRGGCVNSDRPAWFLTGFRRFDAREEHLEGRPFARRSCPALDVRSTSDALTGSLGGQRAQVLGSPIGASGLAAASQDGVE
jgi:hypothetical protein